GRYTLDLNHHDLKAETAMVAFFSGVFNKWAHPAEHDLVKRLNLELVITKDDGSLYRLRKRN
ncbi:MAG TPA: hypothetical protein VFM05_11480, partial [Candidatus Saccharimonadales bacterium]|nr:hypothetical protein [Candidatus Saccharimonadales bacterium]